jgi:FlaA1/EpsC-like NDP-sugar epimerase
MRLMHDMKRELFSTSLANVAMKSCVDILLLSLGYVTAFVLRFDGGIEPETLRSLATSLPFVVAAKIALLYYFGAYRGIYRYASITDLVGLFKAATIGSILAIGIPVWLGLEHSRGVMVIDWLLSIMLLGAVRFSARILSERNTPDPRGYSGPSDRVLTPHRKNSARRVLIYGAGDAGEMIVREMTRGKYSETYRAVGFVDDHPGKQGKSIHGLPVLGMREDIAKLVNELRVDQIVITIPSARGREIRTLLAACEKTGAELKIVPGLAEIVDGRVQVSDIRNVRVDDILGREKVDLNLASISSYITGRRILVTGAGGSIGSEICRQLLRFHPAELLLFGRGENSIFALYEELHGADLGVSMKQIIGDVINRKKLVGVVNRYRPEIIFHAGADKHVPLMEINPDEAVLNNVIGTKNVLEVAEALGVEKVVCISTDKAVNPTSVMGCCKRIAEMLVQSGHFKGTTACAVRFGNVLGSRGSVIPVFQRQIARGGPITITHPEIRRYFMTISEASQLVIQAGAMGEGSDLFLLDMGDPVRIVDLARDMIRLAGLEPDEDVQIRYVGLRAGEKLHEDLWLPTEQLMPTTHEKISRVISPGFDFEMLDRRIRVLTRLAVEMDEPGIVKQLQGLVPEYRPKAELQGDQGSGDTAIIPERGNISSRA